VTFEGNEAREARRAREKLPVAVQDEMILEAKRKYDASPEAALARAASAEYAAEYEAKRAAKRERKKLRALGQGGAVPPPPAEGWRAVYPIHPVALLFPRLSADELGELAADIKAHGLREPVTLAGTPEQPCLLDGVNRLDAMEQAGVPFDVAVHARWEDDAAHVVAVILSKNLHRRHLTATQKVEIAQAALAYGTEVSHSAVQNPQGGRPLGEVGTLAQATKLHPNTVRAVLDKQKGRPKKPRRTRAKRSRSGPRRRERSATWPTPWPSRATSTRRSRTIAKRYACSRTTWTRPTTSGTLSPDGVRWTRPSRSTVAPSRSRRITPRRTTTSGAHW
jgi:hypothetical protein